MISHLLTSEQAAIVRAGGTMLPIPGDESYEETPPGYGDYARFNGYVAPRAWLVLTGPCDTCGGKGSWLEGRPTAPVRYWCPDCVNGSKIIDLRGPCMWCHGAGNDPVYSRLFPEAVNDLPCPSTFRLDARPACDDGSVSLGRFTIDVQPAPGGRDWVAALTIIERTS
jgi:hypothetical protein